MAHQNPHWLNGHTLSSKILANEWIFIITGTSWWLCEQNVGLEKPLIRASTPFLICRNITIEIEKRKNGKTLTQIYLWEKQWVANPLFLPLVGDANREGGGAWVAVFLTYQLFCCSEYVCHVPGSRELWVMFWLLHCKWGQIYRLTKL